MPKDGVLERKVPNTQIKDEMDVKHFAAGIQWAEDNHIAFFF